MTRLPTIITYLQGNSAPTRSKRADAPYMAPMAPEQVGLNEQLKADMLRRIAKVGLGAFGVGAGGAGLLGLQQLLFKPHVPQTAQLSDEDVELGVPKKHLKRADWADSAVKAVMPTDPTAGNASFPSPAWARGDTQTSPLSMPWALPTAAAAGVGGLVGGHSLVKWLLNKKRKSDIDAEVAAAKKEYDTALQGMYKKSSALDAVYTHLEKRGVLGADLGSAGTYAGLCALYAAALGGGTGALSYNYFKKRDKAKALEDAVKTRSRVNAMSSPPELYLRNTEPDSSLAG